MNPTKSDDAYQHGWMAATEQAMATIRWLEAEIAALRMERENLGDTGPETPEAVAAYDAGVMAGHADAQEIIGETRAAYLAEKGRRLRAEAHSRKSAVAALICLALAVGAVILPVGF